MNEPQRQEFKTLMKELFKEMGWDGGYTVSMKALLMMLKDAERE